MKKPQNKWVCAAIPALLLHCSIGTVYCWSLLSENIAVAIGLGAEGKGSVEWAFSFAIFFLGMSAAFLGSVVEKDIHKSSLIATICFALGMAGTGFVISMADKLGPRLSLIGIYVCYGFIMGIGLGTGYLSPVKTLMLWFKDKKVLQPVLPLPDSVLPKQSPVQLWKHFKTLSASSKCFTFWQLYISL